jgi:hypothetical protein
MRWLAAALLLALAACGPGQSRPVSMAPPMDAVVARHAGTLAVSASGGCEDCGAGQARLSAAQLREAAVLALRASGLFVAVADQPPTGHDLALRIFRVDAPMFGFDMRCTVEIGWTLTRAGQASPVWQQAIESRHNATVGDAFAGVELVRLCWEGAVRNNLAEGIGRLARLPLRPR